jgi:comEA protein
MASNPEPQVGYWVCDAIKQEKQVDFVILPNTIFSDNTSYTIDTLVITSISLKDLNQLLSKNLLLPNFVPISGFTINSDSLGNYQAVPNNVNVKDKYSLITTKPLYNSDKATILSERINDILISYLSKGNRFIFPQMNRYTVISNRVYHSERNEESPKIKININTATQKEFEILPGIGPKTAQKIIDYRKENGLFKSIDEIMNVKGIKEKKFDEIKDLIEI